MDIPNNYFGTRLKLARKMAGMSLQELSDSLENKVTKQALNKYEAGLMMPTNEVLMAISKALNIKPDYFLKKIQTELGEISFRKKATLSKKTEESIIEKARDYVERFIEIENILALNKLFRNPLSNIVINTKEDVERAAIELRKAWELGCNPIPNLVEMLEFKGIKVFIIDEDDSVDGFAVYTTKNVPVVVVNKRSKSLERLRFTIIHELAHILLMFSDSIKADKKTVEKWCHFFSSCFLLPTDMVLQMIGGKKRTYINIQELIAIKEYYGISIRAMVHRLRELEIINDNYYQRWVIYMSKTYGAKDEPGEYKGEERARLFDQLINRALAEGLISLSKAAALTYVDTNSLRKNIESVG